MGTALRLGAGTKGLADLKPYLNHKKYVEYYISGFWAVILHTFGVQVSGISMYRGEGACGIFSCIVPLK